MQKIKKTYQQRVDKYKFNVAGETAIVSIRTKRVSSMTVLKQIAEEIRK